MPRVSIIVPVYNGQRTIEECVESIFAQSIPGIDIQLLLIDNASSDRTSTILDRYRDRATILHEATRGPAAARNRGLKNATGDIIAFTDADCVVHRDWLSRLIEPLRDDAVGIAGGAILARKPCNAVEEFGERIHDHRMAIEYDSPPYAITMNWASRKSVIEEVGPFNEELLRCEDCDLAYRIVEAGYRIVHEPAAVVYHRNEQSLAGLIAEGYAHGYHSIPLLRKHEAFVRTFAAASPAKARPSSPNDARYWRIFNLGRATGKAIGSLRSRLYRNRRPA
ncbi:MAG: glycosyltransferase [Gemmatimonadota bacterium]|nr:glycosyltransferase [Gemmatimonadota bacterium]